MNYICHLHYDTIRLVFVPITKAVVMAGLAAVVDARSLEIHMLDIQAELSPT